MDWLSDLSVGSRLVGIDRIGHGFGLDWLDLSQNCFGLVGSIPELLWIGWIGVRIALDWLHLSQNCFGLVGSIPELF